MKHLKRIRLESGLTQVELSKLSGVSQKHISNMELGIHGKKRNPLRTLDKLLKALGCTYEDLTGK